ncbi:MAG: CHRD domain-containing protein [Acidobacteriota bacterium]
MKILPLTALTIALAFCVQAGPIVYTTNLSGANEAPPNASPGIGFATVTYNDVLHTLALDISFSGLLGTTTASHIHCCTAVADAGTAGVATTTPTFSGFPLGVTSGTYSNTLDLTLATSWNPAFITAQGTIAAAEAALAAGLASGTSYLNIHTTVVPGGEIRGFLTAQAPEPSSALLLMLPLAGLAFVRRRKTTR